MDAPASLISTNPAGEPQNAPEYPSGSWPLDTPGGRFYAEWDDQSPVTREGQLIFFFQFLQVYPKRCRGHTQSIGRGAGFDAGASVFLPFKIPNSSFEIRPPGRKKSPSDTCLLQKSIKEADKYRRGKMFHRGPVRALETQY